MTVGIFRSRIFTAGRAFLRDGRGVSAVETAFAFPVILAAFFIIVEFANMALTIQVGESAVSSALLRLILTNRKDFTYRYERVIAYYPRIEESEGA